MHKKNVIADNDTDRFQYIVEVRSKSPLPADLKVTVRKDTNFNNRID